MGEKYLRVSVIILLAFFQAVFLAMIIKEASAKDTSFALVPVMGIIAIGLAATYLKVRLHHPEYHYEDVWVAVWVPVGAVVCYFLNTQAALGNVIAAGITGTVGSYLPSLFKKSLYIKKIPFAVYCGAFVGMSSPEIVPGFGFVLCAGVVAGGLLVLSKSLFLGVGGKLGLLAFSGVVTTAALFYLLKTPA